MAYLLDTNIVIHAAEGAEPVLDKLAQHGGKIVLSALCLAELQRGMYKHPSLTAQRQARVDRLLRGIPVLGFDAAAARAYGRIIADCGWMKGRDFDRMIAAHAIRLGAVLVTANEADFRDIPGLAVENWVTRP